MHASWTEDVLEEGQVGRDEHLATTGHGDHRQVVITSRRRKRLAGDDLDDCVHRFGGAVLGRQVNDDDASAPQL